MRRLFTCLLAGLLLGLAPGSSSSASAAMRPGCVTKGEFAKVRVKMTRKRVTRIFDTAGTKTGLGRPNELRYYKPCGASGTVQVVFSPAGRVISKSGNWFS